MSEFKVGDRVRQRSNAYNVDRVPAGTLGTVRHVGYYDRPEGSEWSELQVEFDGYVPWEPEYPFDGLVPGVEYPCWPMTYDEVEVVA